MHLLLGVCAQSLSCGCVLALMLCRGGDGLHSRVVMHGCACAPIVWATVVVDLAFCVACACRVVDAVLR
eukprot:8122769-Alexandrium_andersonii.AAC.1